jgi:thioredoxin 1
MVQKLPKRVRIIKEITIFHLNGCPHCANAFRWQRELFEAHPEYKKVPVKLVEERENASYANKFDYWLVPTYYVDGVKMHEGVTKKDIIEKVFKEAFDD